MLYSLNLRVEKFLRKNTEIDVSVDRGKWLELKANESRKRALSSQVGGCRLIFPINGWKTFPSHEIPKYFSYGFIYNYLIDTAILKKDNKIEHFGTSKCFNKGRQLLKSGWFCH